MRRSQPTSISPARRAAFEVLRRVFEHGAWADRALPSAASRHGLAGRERALAQRLAYGAVQRRGTSDHIAAKLAGRSVDELDRPVVAALRLGLFEVLYSARTPEHAAVDQSVELAKSGFGAQGPRRARAAGGLVNAVLRRALREREGLFVALGDGNPQAASIAHSYPEWMVRMWWEELGPADARALMMAMNEPPETAFRVNSLRSDPARLVEDLRATGERIERPAGPDPLVPAEALVLKGRISASLREHLAGGELVGQARSSQAVVSVLDPRPGERVLDLCAGPGVKTTAIAARMEGQGEVVAVELNSARARQISDLAGRLGARNVRVRCADALVADLGGGYDRALVDPPCSDLGALASRPDARWRKSPELVKELGVLQRGLLERAAAALRPGGTLTYSVCTICRRESEAVVSEVLAAGGLETDQLGREYPTVADASDPRYLQSLPHRHGTDGFFIARLRARRSEAAG